MLVKLDRHSMANSLEVRSPFLDRDLVDFSFNFPGEKKVGFLDSKLILKDAYKNNLPKWYLKLPKKGFEVPLKKWLRSDLKHLLEKATKPNVLETLNIKNNDIINEIKNDLLNNKNDSSWKLWTLISYYYWAKDNII